MTHTITCPPLHRKARLLLAHLLLAVTLIWSGEASATDDAYRQARQIFLQGRAAYNQGDFKGALKLFRQAQELYPSVKVDLSIAFTLEKMGWVIQAAESYERYLLEGSGEVSRTVELQVRAKLDGFRKSLATIEVRTELEGALIKIDGLAKVKTPLRYRLYVRPGAHRLTLSTDDDPDYFSKELDLNAGQHVRVLVDEKRTTTPPGIRRRSTPFYKRWWFWTAVGAVVVVGTTVGIAAGSGGSDWVPRGDMGTIDLRP